MTTIVKTDLKLSPLKLVSASYCPLNLRELVFFFEFAEIWHAEGWNCFLDEKMFTVEANFNLQNDKVLSLHSEDNPRNIAARSQHMSV